MFILTLSNLLSIRIPVAFKESTKSPGAARAPGRSQSMVPVVTLTVAHALVALVLDDNVGAAPATKVPGRRWEEG